MKCNRCKKKNYEFVIKQRSFIGEHKFCKQCMADLPFQVKNFDLLYSNSLIGIKEAAKILGVHTETLRRWDNDKIFKSVRIGTRGDRRYQLGSVMRKCFDKNNAKKGLNFKYERYYWKQVIYIKIRRMLEKLKIVEKDHFIEYLSKVFK